MAETQSRGAFLCTRGSFQSMRMIQAATPRGATSPWRKRGSVNIDHFWSYVIFVKCSSISLALSPLKQ